MGGSSSKAARRLPTNSTRPSWAGARTPAVSEQPPGSSAAGRILGSGTKSDAIKDDATDPQFLAQLNRLGPVRVDHHMCAVRPAEQTGRMFKSRDLSESQASGSQPTQNRILGSALTDLLEERKSCRSHQELAALAKRHGMDVKVMESVARFVTSPSVGEGTVVKTVTEDGNEKVNMTAVWVEPSIADGRRNANSDRIYVP